MAHRSSISTFSHLFFFHSKCPNFQDNAAVAKPLVAPRLNVPYSTDSSSARPPTRFTIGLAYPLLTTAVPLPNFNLFFLHICLSNSSPSLSRGPFHASEHHDNHHDNHTRPGTATDLHLLTSFCSLSFLDFVPVLYQLTKKHVNHPVRAACVRGKSCFLLGH